MKYLPVFLLLFSAAECYKILVLLPYPGKSHYMVFEPLLNELTRRGHSLTVVSFFPSSKTNRRDVSLAGLARLNVEVVDLGVYDTKYFVGQTFFNQFAIVRNMTKDSIELCEKILNSDVFTEFINAEGSYDVILVEYFNSDCMLGAVHKYRLPFVGLMSCTLLPWSPSLVGGDDNPATFPSMMQPFTDEMTFYEKLENTFDLLFYQYWHKYAVSSEQEILNSRFGHELPPLEEISRNVSVILLNTHYTLNGVRVLPPSVVEVGGIHLHNKTVQPLPEVLERWATQSPHGFILFSFGSLIRSSTLPPKRVDAILKAFARFPQRFVWKWEDENLKDLPANVLVMRWLPQYDLLQHPNCIAFMTHGGLLSLTEAISSGVPTLIVPVLGDQPGNAAYAHRAGVAQVLALSDISEDTVYRALAKVLAPAMRERAKAFSTLWWDRPLSPMDTAVYYIEKTARYGNLNISSDARLMSRPLLLLFKSIDYIVAVFSLCFTLFGLLCCCSSNKSRVKDKQS